MIFYIHYTLLASGLSAISVLLGVFMKTYTDASQSEIGFLLMTFPFISIVLKPYFCSLADRKQAHRLYLILSLASMSLGFFPFLMVPFFPSFYTRYPRFTWYMLVSFCQVGCGGFGIAWSLGDTLAVNYSQKKGIPYSRMRLTGTVSWGVYGWIIGQINETPSLPRYVPAFVVLHLSLVVEIILLALWKKEDFEMFDPTADANRKPSVVEGVDLDNNSRLEGLQALSKISQTPGSSLNGTLRFNTQSSKALRALMIADSITVDDAQNTLNVPTDRFMNTNIATTEMNSDKDGTNKSLSNALFKLQQQDSEANIAEKNDQTAPVQGLIRNPQVILFRMILSEDGRLIKYLIMYSIFGLLMAPMSFVFLSMELVCEEKGCSFSSLAGYVLISQAAVETVCFLVLPWFLARISWAVALSFALIFGAARFTLYAGWYYEPGVSPYWALIGEWGHGIPYGIYCTLMAEMALMFATESQLFIPEMRRMGLMSAIDPKTATPEERNKAAADEAAMKMALRATMQSMFSGMMDGLGNGIGSLLCGVIVDVFSYIRLWQIMGGLTVGTCALYLIIEVSRSRFSDSYKPPVGTKAHAIRSLKLVSGGEKVAASH